MKVGIEHYLYGMTPYITTVIKEEADLCEQDREDVLQETLYRALRYQCGWEAREEALEGTRTSYKAGELSIKPHQGKASAGWLATIAKNCVKDRLDFIRKHEEMKGVDASGLCANNSTSPDEQAWIDQITEGRYLKGLHKDILTRHILGRESLKDLAKDLQLSYGYIKAESAKVSNLVKKEILGE